jgi:thymidylate synthase (FAD)
MRVIQPSYELLTPITREELLKHLEKCGRTCYKSEDKITDESAPKFIKMLRDRGHHAMLEFFDIQVRFIHNRGFTHEMVRHRLCSYAQESTRYCNYAGGLTVIEPWWKNEKSIEAYLIWEKQMKNCENSYQTLTEMYSLSPQAARGVLPIDVKTEIVVKANLREWMHIFSLRCSSAAHPDMQRVMKPLQELFQIFLPEIYGE